MLGFPVFDADNHYYEAKDAFTRHLDRSMRKRAMQWATVDGKERLLVGGAINRFIPNPTFDPVSKPGALSDFFRAKSGVSDIRQAFGVLDAIDDRPEYRSRDARLAVMDAQGLESVFMLPTLGVGMEAALEHDPPALTAAFRAFNRWLQEDWGFNYRDRIYTPPYISLVDVDWAVEELDYAIEHDARLLLMRPASIAGMPNRRTPGDPSHDRFWARVNEVGITVAVHGGDSSYAPYEQLWGLTGETESFRVPVMRRLLSASPVRDFISSLIADHLFERFPNVRVATIETGSDWVKPLLKKLKSLSVQLPDEFRIDPVQLFMENIWVSPFFEDDVVALVNLVGADRVLFGSDFPHAEGLAEPSAFVKELDGVPEADVRKVMHDNARALANRRPA
jgi:predicted TIM-barrel fold metal-dependent hydrolase